MANCKTCWDRGSYFVTVGLSPIGDEVESRFCSCAAGRALRAKRIQEAKRKVTEAKAVLTRLEATDT